VHTFTGYARWRQSPSLNWAEEWTGMNTVSTCCRIRCEASTS
jgi:hypothetical protein